MKQTHNISIAIADDHPALTKGLKYIIETFGNCSVDIEAINGKDLLNKIQQARRKPDICILDISMPEMNGFEALQGIKSNWSSIKVIMQSSYFNEFNIIKAFREGAVSFIPKEATPKEIKETVLEVYEKGYSYSKWIEKNILPNIHNTTLKTTLTDNEIELLGYIATDYTYQQIADKIGKSKRTIEGYRDDLFHKIGVNSRTGLAIFAIKSGIISIH